MDGRYDLSGQKDEMRTEGVTWRERDKGRARNRRTEKQGEVRGDPELVNSSNARQTNTTTHLSTVIQLCNWVVCMCLCI